MFKTKKAFFLFGVILLIIFTLISSVVLVTTHPTAPNPTNLNNISSKNNLKTKKIGKSNNPNTIKANSEPNINKLLPTVKLGFSDANKYDIVNSVFISSKVNGFDREFLLVATKSKGLFVKDESGPQGFVNINYSAKKESNISIISFFKDSYNNLYLFDNSGPGEIGEIWTWKYNQKSVTSIDSFKNNWNKFNANTQLHITNVFYDKNSNNIAQSQIYVSAKVNSGDLVIYGNRNLATPNEFSKFSINYRLYGISIYSVYNILFTGNKTFLVGGSLDGIYLNFTCDKSSNSSTQFTQFQNPESKKLIAVNVINSKNAGQIDFGLYEDIKSQTDTVYLISGSWRILSISSSYNIYDETLIGDVLYYSTKTALYKVVDTSKGSNNSNYKLELVTDNNWSKIIGTVKFISINNETQELNTTGTNIVYAVTPNTLYYYNQENDDWIKNELIGKSVNNVSEISALFSFAQGLCLISNNQIYFKSSINDTSFEHVTTTQNAIQRYATTWDGNKVVFVTNNEIYEQNTILGVVNISSKNYQYSTIRDNNGKSWNAFIFNDKNDWNIKSIILNITSFNYVSQTIFNDNKKIIIGSVELSPKQTSSNFNKDLAGLNKLELKIGNTNFIYYFWENSFGYKLTPENTDNYINDYNLKPATLTNPEDPTTSQENVHLITAWNNTNSNKKGIDEPAGIKLDLLESQHIQSQGYYWKITFQNGEPSFSNKSDIPKSKLFTDGIYWVHIINNKNDESVFVIEAGKSNLKVSYSLIGVNGWNAIKNDLSKTNIKLANPYIPPMPMGSSPSVTTIDLTSIMMFFINYINVKTRKATDYLYNLANTKYGWPEPDTDSITINWPPLTGVSDINSLKWHQAGDMKLFYDAHRNYYDNVVKTQLIPSHISDFNQKQNVAELKVTGSDKILYWSDFTKYSTFLTAYRTDLKNIASQYVDNYKSQTLGWSLNNFKPTQDIIDGTAALKSIIWVSGMKASTEATNNFNETEFKSKLDNEILSAFKQQYGKNQTPENYQREQVQNIENSINTYGNKLSDILSYAKITNYVNTPQNYNEIQNYRSGLSFAAYLSKESLAYKNSIIPTPNHHSNSITWVYEILVPIIGAVLIISIGIFIIAKSKSKKQNAKYQMRVNTTRKPDVRNNEIRIKPNKYKVNDHTKMKSTVAPKISSSPKSEVSKIINVVPVSPIGKPKVVPKKVSAKPISKKQLHQSQATKKDIKKTVTKGASASKKIVKQRSVNSKQTFTKFNNNDLTRNQGQNIHNLLKNRAKQSQKKDN